MTAYQLVSKEKGGQSVRQLLRLLWDHLSRHRRRQLKALLFVMLISSLAEVLSLAAVLPFLAVLSNPGSLWSQPLVQQWSPVLGISSINDLLLPITLVFVAASIVAGAIRLLSLWLSGRLAAAIGSDLSCEAYLRTLHQPYSVQVARNSSSLIASISADLSMVIFQVLNPLLLLASSALIAVAIVATLLVIGWSIAVGSGVVILFVYTIVVISSKRPLKQLGQRQVALNRQLIQVLQEGLGAIRDVLLYGSQDFYTNNYRQVDQSLRRADPGWLSGYLPAIGDGAVRDGADRFGWLHPGSAGRRGQGAAAAGCVGASSAATAHGSKGL